MVILYYNIIPVNLMIKNDITFSKWSDQWIMVYLIIEVYLKISFL